MRQHPVSSPYCQLCFVVVVLNESVIMATHPNLRTRERRHGDFYTQMQLNGVNRITIHLIFGHLFG